LKILITGSEGQLGRSLRLTLDKDELVGLAHNQLDVTDYNKVREAVSSHRPELIINASAFNDVDGAEARAEEAYAVNELGPRNLAIVSADRGIPLVHLSTDYVFDGASKRPYNEFDTPKPLSVYGASKLAGEKAVRSANPLHYIVRTAWLFSQYGKGFLLAMYGKASLPELSVENDRYGSPTYVPHLAEGIARLVKSENYGTYHIAGRGQASRWDLVVELFRLLGIQTSVFPVSHRTFHAVAARPAFSVLTSSHPSAIVLPRWEEGVAALARYLRSARNPETERVYGRS
jgi:dTDP-4-dehydrorhamnose reductase